MSLLTRLEISPVSEGCYCLKMNLSLKDKCIPPVYFHPKTGLALAMLPDSKLSLEVGVCTADDLEFLGFVVTIT